MPEKILLGANPLDPPARGCVIHGMEKRDYYSTDEGGALEFLET